MPTNWNLIVQGNISLLWCQWSMQPENSDKSVGQLLREFHTQYSNVAPLNIGSLLMASYILFVYPQQAEYNNVDFSRIDFTGFQIHEGTPTSEPITFCRRIRNGLTHGRFTLNEDHIELTDKKQDGSDPFRATISFTAFGDFINAFMSEVKNQHFERKKLRTGKCSARR